MLSNAPQQRFGFVTPPCVTSDDALQYGSRHRTVIRINSRQVAISSAEPLAQARNRILARQLGQILEQIEAGKDALGCDFLVPLLRLWGCWRPCHAQILPQHLTSSKRFLQIKVVDPFWFRPPVTTSVDTAQAAVQHGCPVVIDPDLGTFSYRAPSLSGCLGIVFSWTIPALILRASPEVIR